MKGVGFALVILATAGAGVASAHVFVPMPDDPPNHRRIAQATVPATAVPPSQMRSESAGQRPASLAGKQTAEVLPSKQAIETHRPPVPLLLKPRPAPDPSIAASVTQTAVATPEAPASAEPRTHELAEKAAKAAIEADGYKGVRSLSKGANGIWHARAMRGTTEVSLTVDRRGGVSLE